MFLLINDPSLFSLSLQTNVYPKISIYLNPKTKSRSKPAFTIIHFAYRVKYCLYRYFRNSNHKNSFTKPYLYSYSSLSFCLFVPFCQIICTDYFAQIIHIRTRCCIASLFNNLKLLFITFCLCNSCVSFFTSVLGA